MPQDVFQTVFLRVCWSEPFRDRERREGMAVKGNNECMQGRDFAVGSINMQLQTEVEACADLGSGLLPYFLLDTLESASSLPWCPVCFDQKAIRCGKYLKSKEKWKYNPYKAEKEEAGSSTRVKNWEIELDDFRWVWRHSCQWWNQTRKTLHNVMKKRSRKKRTGKPCSSRCVTCLLVVLFQPWRPDGGFSPAPALPLLWQ